MKGLFSPFSTFSVSYLESQHIKIPGCGSQVAIVTYMFVTFYVSLIEFSAVRIMILFVVVQLCVI